MTFNEKVNPKAKVELFKIYTKINDSYELQGRGVTSWTVETNQDINKEGDVLGYVDMSRGTAQPTQSGVNIRLRKGSKFAEMLFDAWFSGDTSKLDSVDILQKFEFVDGSDESKCKARRDPECMIAINNFSGEAGDYLGFEIDIHYSNNFILGEMDKVDSSTITFEEE